MQKNESKKPGYGELSATLKSISEQLEKLQQKKGGKVKKGKVSREIVVA